MKSSKILINSSRSKFKEMSSTLGLNVNLKDIGVTCRTGLDTEEESTSLLSSSLEYDRDDSSDDDFTNDKRCKDKDP